MKPLKVLGISVISTIACGMTIEHFFGKAGLAGIVAGILLFIWIRVCYDRIEEKEEIVGRGKSEVSSK